MLLTRYVIHCAIAMFLEILFELGQSRPFYRGLLCALIQFHYSEEASQLTWECRQNQNGKLLQAQLLYTE